MEISTTTFQSGQLFFEPNLQTFIGIWYLHLQILKATTVNIKMGTNLLSTLSFKSSLEGECQECFEEFIEKNVTIF